MNEQEYIKRMEDYCTFIDKEGMNSPFAQLMYEQMYKMQCDYMDEICEECKANINDEASQAVFTIMCNITTQSDSGNTCAYVKTEEIARQAEELLYDQYGNMLLDPVDIYEDDGEWCLDCMFGGYFVPGWDGFRERWG